MAEVLITLGIIGVVAALTIPTLIQNYKKSEVETRLQKSYNTFSNAIRRSEVDNGEMRFWPAGEALNLDEFWNVYLKPYFVGAELCSNCVSCGYSNCDNDEFAQEWSGKGWRLGSRHNRITFKLNDGIVIFLPRNTIDSNGDILLQPDLFIDINGAKGPNSLGKDVFRFDREPENGRIIAPKGECTTTGSSRRFCTYEIMSNGWKIPDDYPIKF